MSNGLPSSLVRFLKSSKSHNLLTIPTKISSPDTSTLFTPHFKQTTISSHKHFYAKTPRPPVHTQLNKLPRSSTDIKGIDQMAHKIMNRRLNKNPTLVKNIHFQLKFYPADSVIGMARKSNIAYTFTNSSGGHNFNNAALSEGFKNYKGKYKKYPFFKKILSPLNSAVKRILFRRIVKRSLFASLKRYIPVESKAVLRVRGVFQFRLFILPNSKKERERISSDIEAAVKKLVSGQVRSNEKPATKKEREVTRSQLRLFCPPGDDKVRGSYPRFPFIDKQVSKQRRTTR